MTDSRTLMSRCRSTSPTSRFPARYGGRVDRAGVADTGPAHR
ncbi:hypothetical protein [Micromonospora sp. HUAS LYJ1]|nr:hypothetical protein [Micromonospora sp. HUAS LYJ1]WKU06396.1 hypothetical protein Q2K16_04810 [Micromonospora sp. HUAS LYJ1]